MASCRFRLEVTVDTEPDDCSCRFGRRVQFALEAGTLRVLVWCVLKDGWRSKVIVQGYAMSMVS